MKHQNVISISENPRDLLTKVLKEGAQRMLAEAIEAEVQNYLDEVNKDGIKVIRNGKAPKRQIVTGLGTIAVKRPKLRKTNDEAVPSFTSKILPPYLRKAKTIEELVPWLYLKGISTNNMAEALEPLLGRNLKGFSAATVKNLKEGWQKEYEVWSHGSISEEIIYLWADGVYFNVRLGEDERMCILVLIGATAKGEKKLLAVEAGYRESKASWVSILLKLRDQGMTKSPQLGIGDGAMGFWAALDEVYPQTRHQRCWVHRTANVLDSIHKTKQPEAKKMIHEIYQAPTKQEALKSFDRFCRVFEAKYPKAVEKLVKTKASTLSFYDFPSQHWSHIRSTNPIESMFSTVRLRTRSTKGCGSTTATLTMVFKLSQNAEKHWRRLNGPEFLADIIDARFRFVDGVKEEVAVTQVVSNTNF